MIDLLKDFPFSISPDVNFLFPFSSCTRAWCATGTLPKKFFLTSDVGCKQTLNNLRFENYCFFLSFGMFFWICVAVRAVCLFHGANRCIPWFPFIFQSFKRFLGVFFAFHRFSLVLNDFVLFLPFLDVFPATCKNVITSGMDCSVLFAVVLIVHPLCYTNRQDR